MRVPKLPWKSLIFLLLLICGDVELYPGRHVQENLTDISKLWGIKLIHRNIKGFQSKKDKLETLFTNEEFIINLSETHIASVNSELFQIPGFKFVHKIRIAGEGGEVAMYLSDDLKWKWQAQLETDEIECISVEVDVFKGKSFLVGCIYRASTLIVTCRKTFTKILTKCWQKLRKFPWKRFS